MEKGKSRLNYAALLGMVIALASCTTPMSKLEACYATNFAQLPVPEVTEIKARGKSIGPIHASADHIWDSVMLVGTQKAPVVHADKKTGIVVAPPYVFYVETDTVYVVFLDEMYKQSDDPKKDFIKVNPEDRQRYVDEAVGQVATQAQTQDNLKPGGKWSYLKSAQDSH